MTLRIASEFSAFASAALLLCSAAPRADENIWQKNAIASATSPDGHFTATLGAVALNGVSLGGVSFSIHKNGSNETLAVFELAGTDRGQVKWDTSSKIIVFVPVGSKINWHGTATGYPEAYLTTLH